MLVFKFGGASVKDAAGIRNLTKIISAESDDLLIVVSAFGKTTTALETVLKVWIDGRENHFGYLDEVYNAHLKVITDLCGTNSDIKGKKIVYFYENITQWKSLNILISRL